MKIKFLGTAAAEGVPGIFCTCVNCNRSRAIGGRALRTRSQSIIDDKLLIDFPADTFAHILKNNIQMAEVEHCLITHSHSDHLYPRDIERLLEKFAFMPSDYHLTIYGTKKVGELIYPKLVNKPKENICTWQTIHEFDCFMAGDYRITALPAVHDENSGPVIYQISDGSKHILYAHDTSYFHDSVWDFWKQEKPYFHLVSLDCTEACKPLRYIGHMGLAENIQVRDRMLAEGYADENTIFVCNHFSHQATNVVYDDFVTIAAKEGFLVSYDDMCVVV